MSETETEKLHPTEAMERAIEYIQQFQRTYPESESGEQGEEHAMLWMLDFLVEDLALRFPDELRKRPYIEKAWLARQQEEANS